MRVRVRVRVRVMVRVRVSPKARSRTCHALVIETTSERCASGKAFESAVYRVS